MRFRTSGLKLWHIIAIVAVGALIFNFFDSGWLKEKASAKSLPSTFSIDQRVGSLTTTLDVEAGGKSYGTVTETLVSLTTRFTYTDGTGKVVATANKRLVSWGTVIDVYDGSGRLLSTIQEHVFQSLLKVQTTYSIVDASGNTLAESTKIDFGVTSFTLTTSGGRTVATLGRPAFNPTGDTWTVNVFSGSPVDKRVLVMLAAYKTTADDS